MGNNLGIIETTHRNIHDIGTCGYKNLSTPGFCEKIDWMAAREREGLKMLSLWSDKDGHQGMIEYIPGEYCWRPVSATGYMFIHCLFAGLRKKYTGKGYATALIQMCIEDSMKKKKKGVASVTRKGSFMSGSAIFEKNGFQAVDHAPPDFDLVVKKFDPSAPDPAFVPDLKAQLDKYARGLYIIRAPQCPYTVKNVEQICETARQKFHIDPVVITLNSCNEAQQVPNPYGTFSIIYNGKIIAHHPISNKRFLNIMEREM